MANLSSTPLGLLREILCELRIDKKSLSIMSSGYSPNRSGIVDLSEGEEYIVDYPVIQLSQKLAEDIDSLDINWDLEQDI